MMILFCFFKKYLCFSTGSRILKRDLFCIFPFRIKENQENISKHNDAVGIYARNRLWACENKFSSPKPFSLHYRKR